MSPRIHSVKYLGVPVLYGEFRKKLVFLSSLLF